MIAFFVALAIVVGVVEISVIIQVGQWIGFLNTVGLLLLVSLMGAWLVKRQGLGVMARIREQRSAGRIPATEAFDGALILVAGVLLVIPGFVTDAFGLLLLFPPIRAVVRRFVSRRVLREVEMVRSKQWTRGEPPPRQYVPPEQRPPPPPTPLPPASPPDR
ncbi:MAG TPA: FxsA family protein [Acidimicrobiia bacterium]|nr:FxsA family protein [Acidimicrobiia bacterium]